MKKISILFTDYPDSFFPEQSCIIEALRKHYEVCFDMDNPDFVFYSNFGLKHLSYSNAVRIHFSYENTFPNFNVCDFSLSHARDLINGRNLHFPLALIKPVTSTIIRAENPYNRPFCSFVYNQSTLGEGAKLRKLFCEFLSSTYRKVDCPGKVLNNMHAQELAVRNDKKNWQSTKINFLNKYKFNIAFENSDSDGYITEKLTDAFLADTVPIYWGSRGNIRPFPKDAIICAQDFDSFESLTNYIKEVDSNEELYNSILQKNPFHSEDFAQKTNDALSSFLCSIVDNEIVVKDKDMGKNDPVYHLLPFAIISNEERNFLTKLINYYYKLKPYLKRRKM